MSGEQDPTLWQKIAEYGWLLLAAPITYVWKKTTSAVSREELREAVIEAREERKELRAMIRSQFQAAEIDRANFRKEIGKVTDVIHTLHVDLLEKLQK